jgi:hypothetical protein
MALPLPGKGFEAPTAVMAWPHCGVVRTPAVAATGLRPSPRTERNPACAPSRYTVKDGQVE